MIRLKNRPRVQISLKAPTGSISQANRSSNPLLAKRRLINGPLISQPSTALLNDENSSSEHLKESSKNNTVIAEHSDETVSNTEISSIDSGRKTSEVTQGSFGLLANRRRPLLRRPGTIVRETTTATN